MTFEGFSKFEIWRACLKRRRIDTAIFRRRSFNRRGEKRFRETDLMARANGSSTFLAERARFSFPSFYSTGAAANGSLENRAQKCFPVGD